MLDHRESTARQYALTERVFELGWGRSQIAVIDEDQGRSGQTAEGRPGFQRLLAEVALDQVGLILGLEMSRLCLLLRLAPPARAVCAVSYAPGRSRWAYDPTITTTGCCSG